MAKKQRNNRAYGLDNGLQQLAPQPIEAQRAPTTADLGYQIGTLWIHVPADSAYTLVSNAAGLATWTTSAASGVGAFTALTVTPGAAVISGTELDVQVSDQITLHSSLAAGNAIRLNALAGGIDFDALGSIDFAADTQLSLSADENSDFTVAEAGQTLTLESTLGSVIVTAGEAVLDAVQITASNAAGGILATSGALAATTGLHLAQGATTAALQVGSGAPAHSAPQGSLYLRVDGSSTSTRAYINTDGATNWTNLVTAA